MGRFVFKLPDVGEGTAEAELVAWHVKVGDVVAEDQIVADVMTDKATVEITAPVSGTVTALHGEPGAMVPVRGPLVEFEVEGAGNADDAPAPAAVVKPDPAPVVADAPKVESPPVAPVEAPTSGNYVFKLPDVGEGTAEAELVGWHVNVGDAVEEDQILADVMTDKATVEITSPVDCRRKSRRSSRYSCPRSRADVTAGLARPARSCSSSASSTQIVVLKDDFCERSGASQFQPPSASCSPANRPSGVAPTTEPSGT